jgi:hypothetical protein
MVGGGRQMVDPGMPARCRAATRRWPRAVSAGPVRPDGTGSRTAWHLSRTWRAAGGRDTTTSGATTCSPASLVWMSRMGKCRAVDLRRQRDARRRQARSVTACWSTSRCRHPPRPAAGLARSRAARIRWRHECRRQRRLFEAGSPRCRFQQRVEQRAQHFDEPLFLHDVPAAALPDGSRTACRTARHRRASTECRRRRQS